MLFQLVVMLWLQPATAYCGSGQYCLGDVIGGDCTLGCADCETTSCTGKWQYLNACNGGLQFDDSGCNQCPFGKNAPADTDESCVDACVPNPCKNNGVCVRRDVNPWYSNGFRCDCVNGFINSKCTECPLEYPESDAYGEPKCVGTGRSESGLFSPNLFPCPKGAFGFIMQPHLSWAMYGHIVMEKYWVTMCQHCPQGKYKVAPGMVFVSSITDETAAKTPPDYVCKPCAKGRASDPSPGGRPEIECHLCQQGKYSPVSGATSCLLNTCTCPNGIPANSAWSGGCFFAPDDLTTARQENEGGLDCARCNAGYRLSKSSKIKSQNGNTTLYSKTCLAIYCGDITGQGPDGTWTAVSTANPATSDGRLEPLFEATTATGPDSYTGGCSCPPNYVGAIVPDQIGPNGDGSGDGYIAACTPETGNTLPASITLTLTLINPPTWRGATASYSVTSIEACEDFVKKYFAHFDTLGCGSASASGRRLLMLLQPTEDDVLLQPTDADAETVVYVLTFPTLDFAKAVLGFIEKVAGALPEVSSVSVSEPEEFQNKHGLKFANKKQKG